MVTTKQNYVRFNNYVVTICNIKKFYQIQLDLAIQQKIYYKIQLSSPRFNKILQHQMMYKYFYFG